MELTPSFLALLQHFAPVFTAPTHQTFALIVTGWILSHRHRYITEVIFSCGKVGIGHWCRFHRFFSHAAWDLDEFSMFLAKLVVTILAPGATILWAVDDTLCRKRGLTLYGAGMHYDPLISSRAKTLVSWGHDWVVLCLIVVHPFWAPTKVFALPIAFRLYRNRQGLTKGKKGRAKAKKTKTAKSSKKGAVKKSNAKKRMAKTEPVESRTTMVQLPGRGAVPLSPAALKDKLCELGDRASDDRGVGAADERAHDLRVEDRIDLLARLLADQAAPGRVAHRPEVLALVGEALAVRLLEAGTQGRPLLLPPDHRTSRRTGQPAFSSHGDCRT